MRPLSWLALASLVAGVALLGYGAATGQGRIVLIFPVFEGLVSFVGGLLVMLAMFLWFLSAAGAEPPAAPEPAPAPPAPPSPPVPTARAGGVVFLGPFPIVFGSDPQVARAMLILGIVLAALLLLAFLVMYLSAR